MILVGSGLLPTVALPQPGVSVTPSASLVKVYDDNIFALPTRPEEDHLWRLSPAIELGYQSAALTLQGRYTQDAEAYARHTELDTARARRHAVLDFRYRSTRRLTLAAGADYTATQTPGELNLDTGLDLGRARAERLSGGPLLEYQFDPVTAGSAAYTFTGDKLAGGIATDTHAAELRVSRNITRRSTAIAGYTYRRFVFEGADAATAHVLVLGGTHAFTPRTSVTFLGGPRYSDGSTDPEVSASVRHALARGELSLEYGRSQSTAIGLAGAVRTEAVAARAAYDFGPSLEIRAASRFARSARAGFEADAYSFGLEASYRINASLAVIGSYQWVSQRGSLDAAGAAEMTRRIALLGLVARAPWADRRAAPAGAPGLPRGREPAEDRRPRMRAVRERRDEKR